MDRPFTHIKLNETSGNFGYLFIEAKRIATLTDKKVTFVYQGININITKVSNHIDVWQKLNMRYLMVLLVFNGITSISGQGW